MTEALIKVLDRGRYNILQLHDLRYHISRFSPSLSDGWLCYLYLDAYCHTHHHAVTQPMICIVHYSIFTCSTSLWFLLSNGWIAENGGSMILLSLKWIRIGQNLARTVVFLLSATGSVMVRCRYDDHYHSPLSPPPVKRPLNTPEWTGIGT